MNLRVKHTLRALAAHIGVRIKYVGNLPAKCQGFIDPSPQSRTIVVNANKPKAEHIFTILHEIGHYLLHYKKTRREYLGWLVNRSYRSTRLSEIAHQTRRALRLIFNQEWEADLWAMCAFPMVGTPDDLLEFLRRHPEKTGMFFWAVLGRLKVRCTSFMRKLTYLGALIPRLPLTRLPTMTNHQVLTVTPSAWAKEHLQRKVS